MSIVSLLDTVGFRAAWNPELLLLIGLVAAAYFIAIGPQRQSFPDSQPVSLGKKITFVTGLLLFYLCLGSPLNLLGHFMFSAHMLQQCLLYLVMPLLILLGMPEWLLLALISPKWINRIVQFFSKPVLAVLLFNMLFSFYHVPFILDAAKQNVAFHNLAHLALLTAAFFMWIPVVSPIRELDHLSDLRKIGYLFANGVLITPACALIIFASAPLYTTFTEGPQLFCAPFFSAPLDKSMFVNPLSPLEDQRLGGIMMKLTQEFTYACVLAYIFARWIKKERQIDPLEPQPQ
ncbi:MAG: cytochrome c oxidase assembly factor CtaG [Clostridia bacterium]